MGLNVRGFIKEFRNLSGTAIGEQQKSFNLLLKNIPSDHYSIIALLRPQNHLERLFKLQLLLKLERFLELIEILRCEDEHLVAKLLKSNLFCQKLASVLEENCIGFVDNVFPSMSYVTRRRLLKKLAIYGNNLNTLFDEVCNRYGIHIASDVLLGCTEAKIESVLEKFPIQFTKLQFKLLCKKFPSVFWLHIIQVQPHDYNEYMRSTEKSIGAYVATNDIRAFVELASEHNLKTKLGKRLTRKLLLNFKEDIIANADKFINSLHARTLIKTLGIEDFKRFYFKCFPSNINSFPDKNDRDGFYNVGQKLGKRYYPLLLEGVKQLYSKSLYDYPMLVDEKMMETMEVTEREKWVAIKRQSDMDLIEFLKTSESIPAIKNKISVTSIQPDLKTLLKKLVRTCLINQDLDAIFEVVEYISCSHRNDNELLPWFLFMLHHHFDLKKLEERHWKLILPLISIMVSQRDSSSSFRYDEYDFFTAYTEFLYNTKKLSEEDIIKYIKFLKDAHKWLLFRLGKVCDDLKKIILLKVVDLMPELMEVEKRDKLYVYDLLIISLIINWNVMHTNNKIPVFDHSRLANSFRKALQDAITLGPFDVYHLLMNDRDLNSIMKFIICKTEKSDLRDEAIKGYFLVGFRFYDTEIDLWLLKFQPEIIAANFHKFMDHLLHQDSLNLEIIHLIKKYNNYPFVERTVQCCLSSLRNWMRSTNIVFKLLAALSSSEDFLQYVSPYYPCSEDEMNGDEKSRKKRDDAMEVARSFKHATDAVVLVLPTLMIYCKGMYLDYCLESMYYLFYHLPEKKLSTFVNGLSRKPDLAKTHIVSLTCIVGSVADVKSLVTRFIDKERCVSVQKHSLTAALKYFTRNPSDDFWEFLKMCMIKLDKSNAETFKVMLDSQKIPVKYRACHMSFVVELLKKARAENGNKSKFLSSLPSEVIKDLPLEFFLEIIAESFLKNQRGVDEFIVSCLVQTDFRVEIFKEIFDAVSKLKKWKDKNYTNLAHQKSALEALACFIQAFVSKIAIEERNEEILHLFSQKWYELFGNEDTEAIEEHIRLTFGRFYCQFGGEDLFKLNKANMDFLKVLMMTHGIGIVDVFAVALKTTFDFYDEHNKAFYKLCMDIIARNELIFSLLVIQLLPKREPSDYERQVEYKEIVQILRGTSTKLVILSVNRHIRNMSFSE